MRCERSQKPLGTKSEDSGKGSSREITVGSEAKGLPTCRDLSREEEEGLQFDPQ